MTTRRPISPELDTKCREILLRIAPHYEYHGVNVKSCYEDFDKHNIGSITESQVTQPFSIIYQALVRINCLYCGTLELWKVSIGSGAQMYICSMVGGIQKTEFDCTWPSSKYFFHFTLFRVWAYWIMSKNANGDKANTHLQIHDKGKSCTLNQISEKASALKSYCFLGKSQCCGHSEVPNKNKCTWKRACKRDDTLLSWS